MQERVRRQASSFRFTLGALALIAIAALPHRAAAQLTVGGYVGGQFDMKDNWVLYGADARIPLSTAPSVPVVGQARFTYHSFGSGASATQVDVNLLLPLELAHPGQFHPHVGAGLGWVHESATGFSENKVGLNLITGADIDFSPTSPVFGIVQTEYTIATEYPNSYVLTLGVGVHLGGSKR
jgi:hypothetical protein